MLRERDRETASAGEGQREREGENPKPTLLGACTEQDAGPHLTNR